MKILIIEDDLSNLKLTAEILINSGYEVLPVREAKSGIAIAREQQPDLIIMDIQIPGIDGLTATEILKSDSRTSHIKIIAVTSYVMPGDQDKILEAGCDAYIPKPIQYKHFLNTIKKYLPDNSK